MKITKKMFKIAVPIAAFVLAAVFVLAFMLTSYADWRKGYDGYLADLQWKKDNAGTKMTGMTLALAEGTTFYDNGRARPKKKDFVLTGNYIVDGVREYTEPIIDADYTLTVPNDFYENGGKVTATYAWYGEGASGETEDAQPLQTFEASLDLTLTALVPNKLELLHMPYLVRYEEGDRFDLTGAEFEVSLNDGSVLPVDNGKLTVPDTPLRPEDKTVKVSYATDGGSVSADIPVTVMEEGTFTNGELLSLEVVNATVEDGKTLGEAQIELYGVYDSGNYVRVAEEDYDIVNADETASLGGVHVIEISASADGTPMFCTANARVRKDIAAGTPEGNRYTFKVDSSLINRSELSVLTAGGSDNVYVASEAMTVAVNGSAKTIAADTFIGAGGASASGICEALLGKGENTVTIEFATAEDAERVGMTGICLESGSESVAADTLGDYITAMNEAGRTISLSSEAVVDFETGTFDYMYGYGLTNDGKDVYIAVNSDGSTSSKMQIIRVDPIARTVTAKTQKVDVGPKNESYDGLFFYDGKVIACTPKGLMYVDAGFEGTNTAVVQPYDGIAFPDEIGNITNVAYNAAQDKFAVTSESYKLYILDGDMNVLYSADFARDAGGRAFRRMTGTDEYLYLSYTLNAYPNPYISVLDWSGKTVAENVNMETDTDDMGYMDDPAKSNVQAVMEFNGSVYYLVTCWGVGTGHGLFRASFVGGEYTVPEMSFGEYIEMTAREDITPDLAADRLINFPWGQVYGGGDTFGITTDGKYGYFAYSKVGENMRNTLLIKFDLVTGAKLGETNPQEMDTNEGGWHDHSQLFYKDGWIYAIDYAGGFWRVWADDIDGEYKPSFEAVTDIVFDGLDGKVIGVTPNNASGGWAVYTDADELAFYDSAFALVKKVTAEGSDFAETGGDKNMDGKKYRAGVAGNDDYVYVLQNESASLTATLHIYDWQGNHIATSVITGLQSGDGSDYADDFITQTRTMGVTELGGRLYFSLSNRSGTYVTLYSFTPDLSVFEG